MKQGRLAREIVHLLQANAKTENVPTDLHLVNATGFDYADLHLADSAPDLMAAMRAIVSTTDTPRSEVANAEFLLQLVASAARRAIKRATVTP